MSTFDLRGDDRVALVTGGASGIGLETAKVFARAGYAVVVVDLDDEAGSKALAQLEGSGATACFVRADVACGEQIEQAVQSALEIRGRLDFVFNNAGIAGRGGRIDESDEEDVDRVLAIDLKGAFNVCKFAVAAQRGHGGGSILNVASITAEQGSAYFPAYSAAKAGVIALTRSVARNCGRFNIRINCLNPGSIAGTGLMRESRRGKEQTTLEKQQEMAAMMRSIPLGRPGRPADIAHFALFLASPLAAYIHGAVLTIDGGESLGYH